MACPVKPQSFSVSAYATAWAARIRKRECPSEPAFTECLNWLRNNQNDDGSWGSEWPMCHHERIITTLIAIIVFKQWNFSDDISKINHAINYVNDNMEKIISIEENFAAFESILFTLIEEAKVFAINIEKDYYEYLKNEKSKKLDSIKRARVNRFNDKNSNWFLLFEAYSDIYDKSTIEKLFKEEKCIAQSLSATCFALYSNYNLPIGYNYIESTIIKMNGGIPDIAKSKIFDIIWSYNYLIWTEFDQKNLGENIKYIENSFTLDNRIGFSNQFEPDADTTALSIFVLKHLKILKPLDGLLKHFNDDHFLTYFDELSWSISTNINCLICLKEFPENEEIQELIVKVSSWIKINLEYHDFNIKDKWHISKYYTLSRAIMAFIDIDEFFVEKIILILSEEQRLDGGWGIFEKSTNLETSFNVISIVNYMIKRNFVTNNLLQILNDAKIYLSKNQENYPNMWIAKSLYSLIGLDECIVLSASYLVEKFLRNYSIRS